MRKVTTTLTLLCVAAFAQQKGSFIDPRDNKTYKTVKVGTQTWMAQNMNYLPETAAPAAAQPKPAAAAAQGGGWGMATSTFRTSHTQAKPGEELSITYQFKNITAEELPGGKRGGALIGNSGEIVEIIGTDGFGKMPVGFEDKKPTTIKGKIPQNMAAGKYSLRLVVQRKGEKDWKVVSDSLNNTPTAIEFNVYVPSKTGSWCYEDKDANCDKYGRLYTYETAKNVCPAGYHLPSFEDLDKLSQTAGTKKKAKECFRTAYGGQECNVVESLVGGAKKLKAKSGWGKKENGKTSGNGTDNYGFSALPTGRRYENGSFGEAGNTSGWWLASSEPVDAYAPMFGISSDLDDDFGERGSASSYEGFSVRCIKD